MTLPFLLPLGALLALDACAGSPDAPAVRAASAPPHSVETFALPYFLCDCDLAMTVLRAVEPLPGFAQPDTAGAVVRTIAAGALIEPADTDGEGTVVVRSAEAIVREAVTVESWPIGAVALLPDGAAEGEPVRLALAAGTRIEVLAAEWDLWFVRIEGVVHTLHTTFLEDPRLGWDGHQPRTQSWLHLTPGPGVPAAWVRIDLLEDTDAAPDIAFVCETETGRAADCTDE